MKLFFRPDKFKDKNNIEIELEDIEIEYIKGNGCTEDDCEYAALEVSLCRNTDLAYSYISFEVHDWEDIQDEVEKIWNAANYEIFKRKNFKPATFKEFLEIINESDLGRPSDRIFKIYKDDKLDEMLEGDKNETSN